MCAHAYTHMRDRVRAAVSHNEANKHTHTCAIKRTHQPKSHTHTQILPLFARLVSIYCDNLSVPWMRLFFLRMPFRTCAMCRRASVKSTVVSSSSSSLRGNHIHTQTAHSPAELAGGRAGKRSTAQTKRMCRCVCGRAVFSVQCSRTRGCEVKLQTTYFRF